MPGYSWGISATLCRLGQHFMRIPETACSKCYAQRGRYRYGAVKNAMQKRLDGWQNDPDWAKLMSIRLMLMKKQEYFRWFDSGDLQSEKMLFDIIEIAKYTPSIQHWLPTQERSIIKNHECDLPDNLTIRVSSIFLGNPLRTNTFPISSVSKHRNDVNCPSIYTENTCGSCRKCWDKNTYCITYLEH